MGAVWRHQPGADTPGGPSQSVWSTILTGSIFLLYLLEIAAATPESPPGLAAPAHHFAINLNIARVLARASPKPSISVSSYTLVFNLLVKLSSEAVVKWQPPS